MAKLKVAKHLGKGFLMYKLIQEVQSEQLNTFLGNT